MYKRTAFNERAPLSPSLKSPRFLEDVRGRGLLNKVKDMLRSRSRQLMESEEQTQQRPRGNETFYIQTIHGFTNGHIVHRRK